MIRCQSGGFAMAIKKILVILASFLALGACTKGGTSQSNHEESESEEKEERIMHNEPVYKEIDAINFDSSYWQAPSYFYDETLDNQGCKALFIRSDYNSEESYAFAYLGLPEGELKNKPAILLLHGGGGTAYYEWVNAWKEKGYVALAVDLEGHIPNKDGAITMGPADLYHASTYKAPHNMNMADENEDITLTWLHYACRTAIIANSFLHNLEGVDKYKVGVCGVSWGGYITSIISGYDDRFAFSIPFYCMTDMLNDSAPIGTYIKSHRCFEIFDNPEPLKYVKTPLLYIGSNSDQYSNISTASKIIKNMENGYISILHRFLHSHYDALGRIEPYLFADNVLANKEKFKIEFVDKLVLSIDLPKGRSIIEGSIYYSTEEEVNKDTKWRNAGLDITNLETNKIININLREGTTYYYASLTDEKGGIYTSIIETY